MAKLGELVVEIKANNTAFNKSIEDTEKKSKKAFKSLGSVAKKGAKIVSASLVALGVASTKFASDLGESVNAVNVVFGESSDIIKDWGDVASEQAGLSKRAFNESSAVIGTLLKKTGQDLDGVAQSTIDVTTRSADLASVFNKDLSIATTAVGAALRGETEPIRQFGIDVSAAAVEAEALSSGLVENKKDITESVKVQARYNLIMEQSASLAGDFAKTNDDLANSSRVLKADLENAGAELGEVFLPVAAKVVGKVRDLTVKLKDQAPIIKSTLLTAWIKFGGNVQKIITTLGGSFKLFGTTIKGSWITAVNSIQIAFNDLAISITTNTLGAVSKFLDVASKLPFVGKKFEEASDSVDGLNDSLRASSEASKEANQASIDAAQAEVSSIKELTDSKIEAIDIETEARLSALAITGEAEEEEQIKKEENILVIKQREQELEEERNRLREERAIADEEARQERLAKQVEDLETFQEYSELTLGIITNLQQVQLNNIETKKNRQIEALDRELLGEEEYNAQVQTIEKDAALESWKLQKEMLAVKKVADVSEIGINTAVAITKALAQLGPIAGPIAGILMGVAGAAQAAVVISKPDPPRPQLATGAFIKGSQRGTEVIVGEGGNSEEIFGMGAKGVPRRQQLANEVASVVSQKLGGGNQTINVYQSNLLNMQNEANIAKVAAQLYEPLEQERKRRGL